MSIPKLGPFPNFDDLIFPELGESSANGVSAAHKKASQDWLQRDNKREERNQRRARKSLKQDHAVQLRPQQPRQRLPTPLRVMQKPISKAPRVVQNPSVVRLPSVAGVCPVRPGSQNAQRKAFLVQPVGLPPQEIVVGSPQGIIVCPSRRPQHTHTESCSFQLAKSPCENLFACSHNSSCQQQVCEIKRARNAGCSAMETTFSCRQLCTSCSSTGNLNQTSGNCEYNKSFIGDFKARPTQPAGHICCSSASTDSKPSTQSRNVNRQRR